MNIERLLILIIFFVMAYNTYNIYNKQIVEGYQSFTDCLNQGYPKDFCIQTPVQSVISDSYCNCVNGQLGTYKHDNQCYCYPFDPLQPYYTEKVFNDYINN